MLETSLAIHEDGGMPTLDGKRQRTLGGIFFFLVRGALPDDIRQVIFPERRTPQQAPDIDVIDWADRKTHFDTILEKPKGKVENVHISIEGRPSSIEIKQDLVLATLEGHIEAFQTFPRGIPEAPTAPTTFFVYVAQSQWSKHVGDKLETDEEASIAVDGAPIFDPEMGGIAVLARAIKVRTGAANRKAEEVRQQRRKNQELSKQGGANPGVTTLPKSDIPDVDDYPPEVSKKLRPLYGARQLFLKRIADIEAMPPEKQRGLRAQQMGLARVDKQIAALEAQKQTDNDDGEPPTAVTSDADEG
jgi:hypothetical protein